jgi:excisionase family DNA binding protein
MDAPGASKNGVEKMIEKSATLKDERQVAEILQCSKDTVFRLRQSGRLGFVKIGGRLVRFRDSDLSSYIERQASAPKSAVA